MIHLERLLFPSLLNTLALGVSLALLTPGAKASRQATPLRADVTVTTTIQSAIEAASPGDQVIIPSGNYTESLTLNKPVSLIGAGSSTTVIQAVAGQRVLTITGATITQSTVISGLTFTGGDVFTTTNTPAAYGGGVLITGTAKPLIQSVVLTNNRAHRGGGIYAASSVTLTNVSVLSNTAASGAGLYTPSALTLINTEFISNTVSDALDAFNSTFPIGGGAYAGGPVLLTKGRFEGNRILTGYENGHGGGLYTRETLALDDTEFVNNVSDAGSGAFADGGGTLNGGRFEGNKGRGALYVQGAITINGTKFINNENCGVVTPGSAMVVTNALFEGNFATHAGSEGCGFMAGALILADTEVINNRGGGVLASGPTKVTGCRFEGNMGDNGAGLFVQNTLFITSTEFISNTATYKGGGLYHDGFGDSRIVNTLFARNRAGLRGAGMYFELYGNASAEILHATIADAAMNTGQGIYIDNPASGWPGGTMHIANTIIANYTTGIQQVNGKVFEDYNLYSGVAITKTGTVTSGGHSMNGAPAFVSPATDDYHLDPDSDAINNGVNAGIKTDFDGDSRPFGSGFDIGIDEYTPVSLSIGKRGPITAAEGSPITYTLTITNSGVETATNLVITDVIPVGASYISGGQETENAVRWTIASLEPRSSTTVQFVVTATATINNKDYQVSAAGGYNASGNLPVVTLIGGSNIYLPAVLKNQ
jgi:uncharacterized repeat protein (TIGR01451 family)